jgi:hypothetical protein
MRKRTAKRLPIDTIKDVLQDTRVWVKVGVVRLFEGETSHYELDGADIVVDVEIMPERTPALCRLGVSHGGVWRVPGVGQEVLVAVPEGDWDADPVIIAELSSGAVPDGVGPSTAVIQVPTGGQVLVHDGDAGDAVVLATKADVQAVVDELETFRQLYNTHAHIGPLPPGGPTGIPGPSFIHGTPTPPMYPSPGGTEVLKAK